MAPPVIPYADWTGFYIGALAGVGSQHTTCNTIAPVGEFNGCIDFQNGTLQLNSRGGLLGLDAGYDWAENRYFVYGVAADWTWTSMKQSHLGVSGSLSYEAKINWLAWYRGRAGLAIDSTVVYLTGGLALGGIKDSIGYLDASSFASNSDVIWGWVAGAGVEHRFSPNWSMKFEYLHYEFQDRTLDWAPGGSANPLRIDHSVDVGRVGLAYRFGNFGH